jgi:hypothetical protein
MGRAKFHTEESRLAAKRESQRNYVRRIKNISEDKFRFKEEDPASRFVPEEFGQSGRATLAAVEAANLAKLSKKLLFMSYEQIAARYANILN